MTTTQQKLIEDSWKRVDFIKSFESLEMWFNTTNNCNGAYDTVEKYMNKDPEGFKGLYTRQYQDALNDVLCIHANTRTIKKLIALGYIELVEDNGSDYEHIRLLKRI